MQRKTILVYANCNNPTAKGDFSFGGNMAADLKREATKQQENIEIILVSTRDGIGRFESLYGQPDNSGTVRIAGVEIGLSAIEDVPAHGKNVIAYIDANYCKPAATDIIKRVVNPDCRLLFIGNANQEDWRNAAYRSDLEDMSCQLQPNLIHSFSNENIYFASAGMSGDRIGMTTIAELADLHPLSEAEESTIPAERYGFMYLSGQASHVRSLIYQYIELTNKPTYVLVGNFCANDLFMIQATCSNMNINTNSNPIAPKVVHHKSLANNLMRRMSANAHGELVLSTGVNSALEAMQDGKLTYYQYMENNENFVTVFLDAARQLARLRLESKLAKDVTDLAAFLFAKKPLSEIERKVLHFTLKDPSTTSAMVSVNQELIRTANGSLANNIFSVINANTKSHLARQTDAACRKLRVAKDTCIPDPGKALRRAAATGKIFELKVLIRFINSSVHLNLTVDDACANRKRTAIHWAAINGEKDAVKLLLDAGASLTMEDCEQKRPVDYTHETNDIELITLLTPKTFTYKTSEYSLFGRATKQAEAKTRPIKKEHNAVREDQTILHPKSKGTDLKGTTHLSHPAL